MEIDKRDYYRMSRGTSQSDTDLTYQQPLQSDHDPALHQAHFQTRSDRSTNATSTSRRNQLLPPGMLSRGVESTSAPSSIQHRASPSPPLPRNGSPMNYLQGGVVARSVSPSRIEDDSGVLLANGHVVDSATPQVLQRPTIVTNGYVDPSPLLPSRRVQYPPSVPRSQHYSQHVTHRNQELVVSQFSRLNTPDPTSANPDVSHIPPLESKGKHSCPRCGRRFSKKSDCEDHKVRCLI